MTKDSPSPDESSILRGLMNLLRFGKAPDTLEGLEQELQELLDEGEEQGFISRQQGEMIHSIFEFKDTLAREIMTPRSEMVCAEVNATVAQLISLVTDKGYTRIPVYSDTLDNIVGILHAKDLLIYCGRQEPPPPLREIAKPAYVIPEKKRIVDLLKEFQANKGHMAIIADEFGSVRGLITLEDILEEIVGEIADEYDKIDRRLKVLDENTIMVDAKIDIEEVEEFFDVEMPKGPYESVGGLIFHQLGRIPQSKETIEVEGLILQVASATRRRVERVKIQRQATSS